VHYRAIHEGLNRRVKFASVVFFRQRLTKTTISMAAVHGAG
jgi:hypothetical protein